MSYSRNVLIVLLTGVFMLGNWMLDVGSIAYFSGYGWLANGFWIFPASMAMHLGWYVALAAFFGMALIALKKEGE